MASESGARLVPAMETEEVPLRRRAGAAGIAACVSAVVVNPLDVVKTRMQAQGFTHVSAATPFRHVVPAGAFPPRRPLQISLAPGCPPRCPTTGNPTVTRLLCGPECNTYASTLDVVRKILRQEGPRALFRGTGTALAIAVPTVGIYLPCYDIALAKAREALSSDPAWTGWVGAAPIVAGAASRTLAVLCVAPLDLVRTRTQAVRGGAGGLGLWAGLAASAAGGGGSGKVAEGGAVRRAASRGGGAVRRLWTGVGPTLARDVPYSAAYWFALEHLREGVTRTVLARRGVGGEGAVGGADGGAEDGGAAEWANASPARLDARERLAVNFFSGVVAGGAVAAATTPLDVVKTRVQIRNIPGDFAGGVGVTSAEGGGAAGRGLWSELVAVAKHGGFRSLFAGWVPRAARAAPTCGIVLVAYELAKGASG